MFLKTIYDIQQLLKRFGTIIYIGDRVADLELMEEEVKQLFESQLIDAKEFEMDILLLRREIMIEKDKRKRVKDEKYDR
uniref:YqgQ family protein n=1 Tax=Aeribacillus sp. FSL K6-3256 TaxID=2954613 RepID=UPI00403F2578